MGQTFTLEFGDKGGSHKFTSARALRAWLNEENNKWSWVLNFSGAHIAETQRNPLTRHRIIDCLQQAEAAECCNRLPERYICIKSVAHIFRLSGRGICLG